MAAKKKQKQQFPDEIFVQIDDYDKEISLYAFSNKEKVDEGKVGIYKLEGVLTATRETKLS